MSEEVFTEGSEVNGQMDTEDVADVSRKESLSKDSLPVVAPKPKRPTSGKYTY